MTQSVPHVAESSVPERLIDSAEECFARYGVPKTTVEDIARNAGVSRATVYRYFAGGRDQLIIGVLLRELTRFHEGLRKRLTRIPDIGDQLVEIVAFTVEEIRGSDSLVALFASESAGLTAGAAAASELLIKRTATLIRPFLESGDPRVRGGLDEMEVAEWFLRATLSFVSLEGTPARSGAEQRDYLARFVLPAILKD
jgi:AcrR family transcriptional regulator